MDDSTANLIVFGFFLLVVVISIIKIFLMSPDELKKKVDESNKQRSDAIKRGIEYSKKYGTKKKRKQQW